MRFGDLEGTPEEISDFVENNGLDLGNYLERPERYRLGTEWVVASVFFYSVSILALLIVRQFSSFITLVSFGLAFWATACVELRWRKPWASWIVVLGMVLLLLLANGTISLTEIARLLGEVQQG